VHVDFYVRAQEKLRLYMFHSLLENTVITSLTHSSSPMFLYLRVCVRVCVRMCMRGYVCACVCQRESECV